LSGRIYDDLWTRKSAELEPQLDSVRTEMARMDGASHYYENTGQRILELEQTAYSQYFTQNPAEQARLLKTVLSNCAFDRGTLSPSYNKPFEILARGTDWGLARQPGRFSNLAGRGRVNEKPSQVTCQSRPPGS
jgi:hypothetical protein